MWAPDSAIAHLGYALVAFRVSGPFAIEAVSVYLVDDYRGLFWLRPALSLAFAAALLSLAGFPLTIGFIAKFHAVASGVDGHHGVLLGSLVAGQHHRPLLLPANHRGH
jgi:NADH-quinone oxidoreductase subunit N